MMLTKEKSQTSFCKNPIILVLFFMSCLIFTPPDKGHSSESDSNLRGTQPLVELPNGGMGKSNVGALG